jgi:tetratricopeptide (TPR) repeat protein
LQPDVLEVDAAAAFLLQRTEGHRRAAGGDAVKARQVATELGGLALTLELAGACIATRGLSFAQYLELWRESRENAWFPSNAGHDRAIAITWQTSFAQLTRAGRRLLGRVAWLASEPIPQSLLDVSIPETEGEALHDALDDLAAYALVERDAEGRSFLVHRLVREMTDRYLVDNARHHSFHEALRWINYALPSDADDDRPWLAAESLEPHARAVTDHPDIAQFPELASNVMRQLGTLLRAKGHSGEAEQVYRRALADAERNLGPNHPEVAGGLTFLGQLLHETDRYTEAEPLMRRALALGETQHTPDDPVVASRLSNLAKLLYATNRLAEAEPLMRRALAIDEKSFGPEHPKVTRRLNDLAQLLQATSRHAEAEPMMRRLLAFEEKNFGSDHPAIATSLTNLAHLLTATRRFAEAEPLCHRALAIDETSFGPKHPNVAIRLSHLARLLHATERLGEAEPLYRRALDINETSLGLDHPDVALDLNNLARLLEDTGRLGEAEPLMRRALAILAAFMRRTRHEHPHFRTVMDNYAGLLKAMGRSQDEIMAAIRTVTQTTP